MSKPTIAEIIASVRIEDVIGRYLTLKKEGNKYLANCPFHTEKTNSFTIFPKGKGTFKCFGCDAHGDVVDFLVLKGRSLPERSEERRVGKECRL